MSITQFRKLRLRVETLAQKAQKLLADKRPKTKGCQDLLTVAMEIKQDTSFSPQWGTGGVLYGTKEDADIFTEAQMLADEAFAKYKKSCVVSEECPPQSVAVAGWGMPRRTPRRGR